MGVFYEIHRVIVLMEYSALLLILYIVWINIYEYIEPYGNIIARWASRNLGLETLWTIIPGLIIIIFINLAVITVGLITDVSFVTHVTDIVGNQWYWNVNRVDVCLTSSVCLEIGDVYILDCSSWVVFDIDSAYKVYIVAFDVLHAFSLPAFGLKLDAVPGRLNSVILSANMIGAYYGQCSELCGNLHGFMPFRVIYMDMDGLYDATIRFTI